MAEDRRRKSRGGAKPGAPGRGTKRTKYEDSDSEEEVSGAGSDSDGGGAPAKKGKLNFFVCL